MQGLVATFARDRGANRECECDRSQLCTGLRVPPPSRSPCPAVRAPLHSTYACCNAFRLGLLVHPVLHHAVVGTRLIGNGMLVRWHASLLTVFAGGTCVLASLVLTPADECAGHRLYNIEGFGADNAEREETDDQELHGQ